MPLSQNENQCQKLFEHLNYCVSILRKSLDQSKIEILKRVQHDIQLLQKYIKSLLKYSDKREHQFEKIVLQLEKKNREIQTQSSQILQLSCQNSRKEQQIRKNCIVIEHLKYSRKIDASYVSSILINQNSPCLPRGSRLAQKKQTNDFTANNKDQLNLSQYSEHCAQEKLLTQETMTTSKSEIMQRAKAKGQFQYEVINEEEQGQQQRGYTDFKENKQKLRASSLIFTQ